MNQDALMKLWAIQSSIMKLELDYWVAAGELIDQGIVAFEDVATIYGVHTSTARKRVKEAHELRANQVLQESAAARRRLMGPTGDIR